MGSSSSVGSSRGITIGSVGSSKGSQVRGGGGSSMGSSGELEYGSRSLLGRKVISGSNSLEEEISWSSSSQDVISLSGGSL